MLWTETTAPVNAPTSNRSRPGAQGPSIKFRASRVMWAGINREPALLSRMRRVPARHLATKDVRGVAPNTPDAKKHVDIAGLFFRLAF